MSNNVEPAGIELIAREREEQIKKHGFDSDHDDKECKGQLKKAAIYLLTGDAGYYPLSWSLDYKETFDRKTGIESLVVAGALIAAEIDRLQRHD